MFIIDINRFMPLLIQHDSIILGIQAIMSTAFWNVIIKF